MGIEYVIQCEDIRQGYLFDYYSLSISVFPAALSPLLKPLAPLRTLENFTSRFAGSIRRKALVRGPSQIAASICGYRISGKFESVLKEEVEQILAACRRTRPRCGEIRTSCDSLMTYRVVFGTQFHFVFLRSTFSVDNSVDSSFIRSY